MKKRILFIIACLFALFSFQTESQAQTKKLIHYWHFNNTVPGVHLVAIPADYSTLGNASVIYKPVKIPGASDTTNVNDYMDNLAGDIINQRSGYGGCCGATNYGVRTRNPSDYMQFLWYIPTKKYQNIVINYETQTSSLASGQLQQLFSYSLDSAQTFTTAGLTVSNVSAGVTWGLVTLDLSSIATVNNNGKLVLKILFSGQNTGNSGNNRFDNITIEGDSIIKPTFTSTALTTGIINRLYSYSITSTGAPAPTYSVSGNPSWLTLADNILSGTPPSVGTFGPVTITATNIGGSVQQVFNVEVGGDVNPVAPVITSTAPTTGIIGSTFIYKIASTGVPKPTISVSSNLDWLVLNDTTLSGAPPTFGVFGPITVTATNIAGSVQQSFNITVPSAPYITSVANTAATANLLYTYTIAALGLPVPDLSISGNPSWITLNGNTLSGTPPSVGTFGPITITATNTEGTIYQTFSIEVSSIPQITSTALIKGTAGSEYTYNISASGEPAPVLSVSGNPAWLNLNGNTLSGTPTSSGLIGPITLTATNIASSTKQTFYLNVINPPVNTSSAKMIHYWHFNNTLPADGSGGVLFDSQPIMADYSRLGGASIIYKPLKGVVSDWGDIDNLVGDTINQRSGYKDCCGAINNALRTRNPSDSMQFLWYMPTTRYQNIVIKYETQLSSIKSGQHEQIFSYSVDSAETFIKTGLPVFSNFADTTWGLVTLDLRSINAINNNRKFVFRIDFSAPNTGSKGNNRFDNITIEGDISPDIDAVPEVINSDYSLYPNPSKDYINLITNSEGEKIISIYNSAGIKVSSCNLSGKKILINTSFLSQGMYFMKIIETTGKNVTLLKFIKE
ncbi:MAG: T9SS type A sorting domain-containing protein [Bacteroidales bacterium]